MPEDLAQETSLVILKRIQNNKAPIRSPGTYARTVARHLHIDAASARARFQTVQADPQEAEDAYDAVVRYSRYRECQHFREQQKHLDSLQEFANRLPRVLSRLRDDDRRVLQYALDGYCVEDIARLECRPVEAVRRKLTLAAKKAAYRARTLFAMQ